MNNVPEQGVDVEAAARQQPDLDEWLARMEQVPPGYIDQGPSGYVLALAREIARLGARVRDLEAQQ